MPAGPSKPSDEGFDEDCVRFVDEAVEVLAAPAQPDVHIRAECRRDTVQRPDRDPVELAAIDLRHECP